VTVLHTGDEERRFRFAGIFEFEFVASANASCYNRRGELHDLKS
jgi:hypothetical protein